MALLHPLSENWAIPYPTSIFAVPGVKSISADIHKNGYAAKGASTVLYSDAEYLKYQGFVFDQWSKGLYSTQTFVGSRTRRGRRFRMGGNELFGRRGVYADCAGCYPH